MKKSKGRKKGERNGKNTERPKKENKWIEDEQKEGIERQSSRSKRERVALVEVKVKSFFFLMRKFQKSQHKIFNEKKFFVM